MQERAHRSIILFVTKAIWQKTGDIDDEIIRLKCTKPSFGFPETTNCSLEGLSGTPETSNCSLEEHFGNPETSKCSLEGPSGIPKP